MTRLRAGTAAVDITPSSDRPQLMECYPDGEPVRGTLDALEARALVLDDGVTRAALVCADLCGLDAPSAARARMLAARATGIPAAHILVMCSHTHSCPAVTLFKGVAVDPDYLAWLEQALADAVVAASHALAPVTVGAGSGEIDFNVNRRRRTPQGVRLRASPEAPADRRVRVLRLDPVGAPAPLGTLGGRSLPQCDPLAVLFSYACHPTVLGARTYRYSGDYPGAARRFIESAYAADAGAGAASGEPAPPPGAARETRPETRALFLPGCAGNLRPHLLVSGPSAEGVFREGTPHECTVLGRLLGSEVVQVAERIMGEPVREIAVATREVRLPYASVATAQELRAALSGARAWWARRLLDRIEREGALPDAESGEVHVVRLGRHWLVTTPGETLMEIGHSIERGLVELGLADPARGDLVLALGYTDGYAGYLCSASTMLEGGYEPEAWPDYQRPGPFALGLEPLLVNTALDLARTIAPEAT